MKLKMLILKNFFKKVARNVFHPQTIAMTVCFVVMGVVALTPGIAYAADQGGFLKTLLGDSNTSKFISGAFGVVAGLFLFEGFFNFSKDAVVTKLIPGGIALGLAFQWQAFLRLIGLWN